MSASPVGTPPAGLVCVCDQQQSRFARTDTELLDCGSSYPHPDPELAVDLRLFVGGAATHFSLQIARHPPIQMPGVMLP